MAPAVTGSRDSKYSVDGQTETEYSTGFYSQGKKGSGRKEILIGNKERL